MKDKKNIILGIILLIVIIFSLLLFYGIDTSQKSGVQICSFIFIIITEILTFSSIMVMKSKKSNTFFNAGISGSTFLYVLCSFLFNILFLNMFTTIKSILVFNFSILLIYIFINLIIILFKKEN